MRCWRGGGGAAQVSVGGGSEDAEGVGDLLHGVLAAVVRRPGLSGAGRGHLELWAALAAAGAGGDQAVLGALDDQVVLELGDRRRACGRTAGRRGWWCRFPATARAARCRGLQLVGERLEVGTDRPSRSSLARVPEAWSTKTLAQPAAVNASVWPRGAGRGWRAARIRREPRATVSRRNLSSHRTRTRVVRRLRTARACDSQRSVARF